MNILKFYIKYVINDLKIECGCVFYNEMIMNSL